MGIATRLGTENVLSFNMLDITDYGRPIKPFFIELLGVGKQIGQINFGAFGVISNEISVSTHLGTVSRCFPLLNHYIYKILSLYIHIPNSFFSYLELGFEFGLQRIRDLAFVCS